MWYQNGACALRRLRNLDLGSELLCNQGVGGLCLFLGRNVRTPDPAGDSSVVPSEVRTPSASRMPVDVAL